MLAGRRGRIEVAATKSSATDVVTEMDRRSEALLVDRLLSQRPDDGVLGEEGAAHLGSTGVRWVLDPIDGTVNYLYGLPELGRVGGGRDRRHRRRGCRRDAGPGGRRTSPSADVVRACTTATECTTST